MTLEIGLVIRRDNEGLVRIPFCIGVGLALLAGPALAQKAERPEVKVGEFRYRNRNLGDIADDP